MPKHVTYPGPHAEVTVVGIPEPVKQGQEIEVESDLADQLVDQGWTSAVQAAAQERAAKQRDETADAPKDGEAAKPADGTSTADAPPADETADETADAPAARRR